MPNSHKTTGRQEVGQAIGAEVIVPVTEPTDWVSSLAYSWKADGDLRTYLNLTHQNKAIRQGHYRTPIHVYKFYASPNILQYTKDTKSNTHKIYTFLSLQNSKMVKKIH